MLVYIEKVVSVHAMGCSSSHFGNLRVQSHRITYNPEDGDIVDPISDVSASGWRNSRPCAIFAQSKPFVRQRFYFARDNSIFDADLGPHVAFEPEPFNQVRA